MCTLQRSETIWINARHACNSKSSLTNGSKKKKQWWGCFTSSLAFSGKTEASSDVHTTVCLYWLICIVHLLIIYFSLYFISPLKIELLCVRLVKIHSFSLELTCYSQDPLEIKPDFDWILAYLKKPLHPSQVMALKWKPVALSPHTPQIRGTFLSNSSGATVDVLTTVGSITKQKAGTSRRLLTKNVIRCILIGNKEIAS